MLSALSSFAVRRSFLAAASCRSFAAGKNSTFVVSGSSSGESCFSEDQR